jgi:isopenicillin-N epimerase
VTQDFRPLWCLDPSVAYLNHGSYGACPRAVLELQRALQLEMEREPVDFLSRRLPERLQSSRATLASFLGADAADLVFVPNATTGVNAVLRSLAFAAGDELLATSHTYAACRNVLDHVAARTGARVVTAVLPFPLRDEEEIVAAVMACVSPRTRLALLDHVTSPTALILPIARLVSELRSRGIETLIDGAHAPGQVRVALTQLGAAYYTGNAHKWLCAPKGAGFLHVRRDRQPGLHPTVISHGYHAGFHAEFDWIGAFDPSPWLCIPAAIDWLGRLLPGGWPELMATNRALALEARALLCKALSVDAPCPDTMIGSMASLALPAGASGAAASRLEGEGLADWFRERGVETWLARRPFNVLRVSAQLYNNIGEVRRLVELTLHALCGSAAPERPP